MKKNKSKEDLKSFLTFDSHPKLIAYPFTFFWGFFTMALLGQLILCLGSSLLIFLFSFVFIYCLVGLVCFPVKKGHYILSILIIGFFWMLGSFAYEGMNCRG